MNTELFIAKRLFTEKRNKKNLSGRIVRIAVSGITIGLTVMIIAVCITAGFKTEVKNKITAFTSHIQIINFDSNFSYETRPIDKNPPFLNDILKIEGVKHIQAFATKPGIIKTDNEIHGMVVKGVGTDYDWSFFKKHLIEGRLPDYHGPEVSKEVLISRTMSKLLGIKTGDPLFSYFLTSDSPHPRPRKFTITGIYDSGVAEFDQVNVFADIRQVQQLNGWDANNISGFEVMLNDFNYLDQADWEIRRLTTNSLQPDEPAYKTTTVISKNPQFFDWLSLLDMNVWIILALMLVVAGINMVSGLLVIILEKVNMIGILKALGAKNYSIRKVFLYLSAMLISRGLLWGNILGLALCFLQYRFQLIKLDVSTYYVDSIPIQINFLHILLLNIGTMICTVAMLVIPTLYISRVSPDKAIQFE
ncbi:MAG: ABC transporter permease [Bacteroidota bacterium]|nr:ABC transporter permease [Bacteroidota bacterium]